jgi:hypothetical protein
LDIEDAVVTVIPDFIILEETGRCFSFDLDIQQISTPLIAQRDKMLIPEKGKKTHQQGDEEQGNGDSIKADSTRFHRRDLTVPGEHAEGEKGGEKNGIGKGPLKGHLWHFIEKVFKDERERCSILDERIHFLKEKDNNINQDQAAQSEAEYLQIFADDIPLNGPVVFKHL